MFRRVVFFVLLSLFIQESLSIKFLLDEIGVERTVENGDVFYIYNVSLEAPGKQDVGCDIVLSRDNRTSDDDYWISDDNSRCFFDGCPSRFEFEGTENGKTRRGTLKFEDKDKLTGELYVILTCYDYESASCSVFNIRGSECFAPQDFVLEVFVDGLNVPIEPPSQLSINSQDSFEVGDNITFSATVNPTAGPVKYMWDFGDQTSSNEPEPVKVYIDRGVFVVSLTVSNKLGEITATKEVTVESGSSGSSGGGKNNGGTVAGVIIGLLIFFILIGILIWWMRKRKGKYFAGVLPTFNVKKSESSMPVNELTFNNRPDKSSDIENEVYRASGAEYQFTNNDLVYPAFTRNYDEFVAEVGNAEISPLVTKCCQYLQVKGLDVEGIFRVPGSQSEMQSLKSSFERGENPSLDDIKEPLTVAGLLKLYCREGKEEIVPRTVYALLVSAKSETEKHRSVVFSLSARQIKTLRTILDLFILITQHADVNLMHPDNLAKVFGPSLFRDMPVGSASSVMVVWIRNYDQIFGL